MNESGPPLKSRRLWAKRKDKCVAILERALLGLREEKHLPEAEVDLNRKLYWCLLSATQELYPKDDIPPTPECNNQPDPDDQSREAREQKRPDFQWIFRDHYEPDPHRSSKQFVVECKRLGKSSRADRVFNLNYVNHGINRFRDEQWAYAKRFPDGAMVGYWQSMEAKEILKEVNAECRNKSLQDLGLIGAWSLGGISRLEHSFDRSFDISPFKLCHLWVDLRQ
jgi:hypothetical protein